MKPFRRLMMWMMPALVLLAGTRANADDLPRLTVKSTPPGAKVILDGKELTLRTPVRLNLTPGVHHITLQKEGYEPVSRQVEVYSGIALAEFNLKPVPSSPSTPPPSRPHSSASSSLSPPSHPPSLPSSATTETAARGAVKVEKRAGREKHPAKPGPAPETVNLLAEDNPVFKKLRAAEKPRLNPKLAKEEKKEEAPSVSKADIFPLLFDPETEAKMAKERPQLPVSFPDIAPGDSAFELEEEEPAEEGEGEESESNLSEKDNNRPLSSARPPAGVSWTGAADSPPSDSDSSSASSPLTDNTAAVTPSAGSPPDETLLLSLAQAAALLWEQPSCLQGDTILAVSEPGPLTCAPAPRLPWPDSVERLMFQTAASLPRFPERFNVLLLGLDRRDARGLLATGKPYTDEELKRKPANSDVIMVIQLDFIDKQVRMVSIPRDTKVTFAGSRRRGRINAAYAYGRQALARATVENFLNIKIHRTVVADWRATKKCISLFKGLGLDYHGFSEQELFWHLRKRSFSRGDFRRIERQQRFLQYAGTEFLRLYNETRKSKGAAAAVSQMALEMAIRQGLSAVETDLTDEEIQILAYAFRDYNMRNLTMAQVSGRGGMEGGGEDTSGIYFFYPSPHHSFDEIIAKVEKQIRDDQSR